MERSYGFPGWCAICRWTAVGAISVGTMAVLGAATSDTGHNAAPTVVRLAAEPEGSGLDSPGWTVRDPAEQRRSLDVLRAGRRPGQAVTAAARRSRPRRGRPGRRDLDRQSHRDPAPASPSAVTIPRVRARPGHHAGRPAGRLRRDQVRAGPGRQAVRLGRDRAGLVRLLRAGAALLRDGRGRAAADLPGAGAGRHARSTCPTCCPVTCCSGRTTRADLSTVHHVAMYLGDGKIVQAPQPGEFVEVTTMWLSGYAGAVRVATGPATAALPPVPVGVPGTGITPAGDAMPDGSPPPIAADHARTAAADPPAARRLRRDVRPGARAGDHVCRGTAATSGTSAPGDHDAGHAPRPGTTSPGTTSPGTTSPGTTSPGTTSPGTTSPGARHRGTTSPGTTAPGTTSTTAPGSTAPAAAPPAARQPSGSTTGTSAPATSAADATAGPGPDEQRGQRRRHRPAATASADPGADPRRPPRRPRPATRPATRPRRRPPPRLRRPATAPSPS